MPRRTHICPGAVGMDVGTTMALADRAGFGLAGRFDSPSVEVGPGQGGSAWPSSPAVMPLLQVSSS